VEIYEKKIALVRKFVEHYGRLPTEVDPDYLEMLQMSKYQISDVPMYKPGKCANCGSSKGDGRKYVDFGLEIDWYGTLFLCGLCLTDVAETMGLFDKYKEEIEKVKQSSFSIDVLREQGGHLEEIMLETFEEVKQYFDNLHSIGADSPSNSPTSVEPYTPSDAETAPRVESTVNEPKSKPVKSTSGPGRKDVPSLADLLNTNK